MSHLKEDFLIDLAKACIISPEILSVVRPHLSYTYISGEAYKHVFKYIFDYYDATGKSPSIGLLSQNIHHEDALGIIGRIRITNVYDSKEKIIETLEEYIKKARFKILWKDTEEAFNKQDQDKALKNLEIESKAINSFSLKRQILPRIFRDFDKRQRERQIKDVSKKKIPFGIPALDYHTRGGQDLGTSALSIARSGAYKSTGLVSRGGTAAFAGFNVVHFAAGDVAEDEIEQLYDSWWTQVDRYNIKEGSLDGKDINKIKRAREAYINQCGEIYVKRFNQFHTASIADCRNILIDILREVDVGLVIFDYLELFDPGDGKRYSTNQDGVSSRKKAVAEKIVNIGTEFNVATATATQASDIKKELWNNPSWVITRNDISNLKAVIDPFAYAFTYNQTEDEKDNHTLRIHEEKLRGHDVKSYESTYSIVQRLSEARFIDLAETKARFWDDENKKVIRNVIKKVKE